MTILSSFSNEIFVRPNLSLFTNLQLNLYCFLVTPSSLISVTFFITFIFIFLPLSILVLFHGLRQWQQTRTTMMPAVMSHSDFFTYHLSIMELIGVTGCIWSCCAIYKDKLLMIMMGGFLWSMSWYGETFFHVLTCLDRYLAVVYPLTY